MYAVAPFVCAYVYFVSDEVAWSGIRYKKSRGKVSKVFSVIVDAVTMCDKNDDHDQMGARPRESERRERQRDRKKKRERKRFERLEIFLLYYVEFTF